jgi:hypothetical protein
VGSCNWGLKTLWKASHNTFAAARLQVFTLIKETDAGAVSSATGSRGTRD